MIDKIKAIRPQIIVTGTVEKPYYEILYYDTSDNVWHIGYSSYNLANVVKWKEEFFEVVGEIEDMQSTADVVGVKHGKWSLHPDGSGTCKICNTHQKDIWDMDNWQNFCGHCGAKMDGGKAE